MALRSMDVGDGNIAYGLSGPAGAPVVMLSHCFSADHAFWEPHLAACDGFQVLAYDTRGHGASSHTPGPYSLGQLTGDAIGLLDRLGIDAVHFAGVSMGGMIGQTMALDHPTRVRSLALVNTTPVYSEEQRVLWRERAALVLRDGIEPIHEDLMRRWFTDAAIADGNAGYRYMAAATRRFAPESFDAVSAALCGLDTVDRLKDIKVPTMVVAAPEDPGIPREVSQLLADQIPGAALHWLSPARHLATLEHVAPFNRLLADHLAKQSSQS